MERIHLLCPHAGCFKMLTVNADARGRRVICQACGRVLRVPLEKARPVPLDATNSGGVQALVAARLGPQSKAA